MIKIKNGVRTISHDPCIKGQHNCKELKKQRLVTGTIRKECSEHCMNHGLE